MKTLILFLMISASAFAGEEIVLPSEELQMDQPTYSSAEQTFTVERFLLDWTLIGGVIATPGEFEASPWVGNCTAAVVGERVLFTAAHCVSNGGTKNFTIKGVSYSSKCAHHPEYRGNSTADFAVCLVNKKVEGIPYEVVATTIKYSVGLQLLLSGYGCQKWGGGLDGKYRIGKAKITKIPSGSNYDTVTVGDVALCSGDSGGPAWQVFEDGTRELIGVNSRSNTTTTSYLSSHATVTAQNFYKSWAQTNSVRICGIHADAQGCRSGSKPQTPVTFTVKKGDTTFEITWEPDANFTIEEAKLAFEDAADYLEEK